MVKWANLLFPLVFAAPWLWVVLTVSDRPAVFIAALAAMACGVNFGMELTDAARGLGRWSNRTT